MPQTETLFPALAPEPTTEVVEVMEGRKGKAYLHAYKGKPHQWVLDLPDSLRPEDHHEGPCTGYFSARFSTYLPQIATFQDYYGKPYVLLVREIWDDKGEIDPRDIKTFRDYSDEGIHIGGSHLDAAEIHLRLLVKAILDGKVSPDEYDGDVEVEDSPDGWAAFQQELEATAHQLRMN